MPLIIALVLFAYIIFRAALEKAGEISTGDTFDNYRAKQAQWLEKVTDPHFEAELQNVSLYETVERPGWSELDHWEQMRVKREMYKDKSIPFLVDIIGDEDEAKWYRGHDRYAHKTYLRILMAKRGKLLYDDAENGIWSNRFYNIEPSKEPTPPYSLTEDAKRFCILSRKIIFWIDEQLKQHGIDEALYVGVPLGSGFWPVETFGETTYFNYRWEPAVLWHKH